VDPTLEEDDPLVGILDGFNILFTVVFGIETALKIFVHGFVIIPKAYLRDSWNQMDFGIVSISVLSLCLKGTGGEAGSSLKALRVLRVLRPLRTIKRAPTLKVVVDTVLSCLPSFINIILMLVLLFFTFSILGTQLWAGKFWFCNDGVSDAAACSPDTTYVDDDGNAVARKWINPPMNFDNVLTGLLTLTEVSTLEMWLEPMYSAMDVPSNIGKAPQQNQNAYFAIYFVIFIALSNFIVLNLFTSAVCDCFARKEAEGNILTEAQKQMAETLRMVLHMQPSFYPLPPCIWYYEVTKEDTGSCIAERLQCQPDEVLAVNHKITELDQLMPVGTRLDIPPARVNGVGHDYDVITAMLTKKGCWARFRHYIYQGIMYDSAWMRGEGPSRGKSFEVVVLILIALNVLVMALAIWCPPDSPELKFVGVDSSDAQDLQETAYNDSLEMINTVFTFLFLMEALLKLLAFGPSQYWQDKWNRFDVVVVLISIVGFLLNNLLADSLPINPSFFRVIRAFRAIRIMRMMRSMKKATSLLETLFFSMFEIFNVVCIYILVLYIYALLGMTWFGDMPFDEGYYQAYNRHANFRSVGVGMLTLFRMSTGESWNAIMHDCMEYSSPAWIYFVSFMIIGANMLMPLTLAIIIRQFQAVMDQDNFTIRPQDLNDLNEAWTLLDPFATHYITVRDIDKLLMNVQQPLGIRELSDASSRNTKEERAVQAAIQKFRHLHNVDQVLQHATLDNWRRNMQHDKKANNPIIAQVAQSLSSLGMPIDKVDGQLQLANAAVPEKQQKHGWYHSAAIPANRKKGKRRQCDPCRRSTLQDFTSEWTGHA